MTPNIHDLTGVTEVGIVWFCFWLLDRWDPISARVLAFWASFVGFWAVVGMLTGDRPVTSVMDAAFAGWCAYYAWRRRKPRQRKPSKVGAGAGPRAPAGRECDVSEITEQQTIDHVAWALHCWTCPLCFINGTEAMANSDQDHVTEVDRQQAAFLVGALGLAPRVEPELHPTRRDLDRMEGP